MEEMHRTAHKEEDVHDSITEWAREIMHRTATQRTTEEDAQSQSVGVGE